MRKLGTPQDGLKKEEGNREWGQSMALTPWVHISGNIIFGVFKGLYTKTHVYTQFLPITGVYEDI